MDDRPIEPPPAYDIVFRTGAKASYRIKHKTMEQIGDDLCQHQPGGVYDVEDPYDGSLRKLVVRFDDLLYIG